MAPPPLSSRPEELENSRLGVIYFLGNLQVDFAPESSATDLKNKALAFLQDKVGDGKLMTAATKVGGVVEAVDGKVDQIAEAVQNWLAQKFNFAKSDIELAIQHVRYNLLPVIYGIQSEARKTASDFSVTDMASGLYTGITETIKYFNVRHAGKGVVMESGHPDIVATSIKWSIAKSALVGLGEAALAGAKAALAAFTGGVGLIINKVAGIIELILRFAVRFCDALTLRKIFADCKSKWSLHRQNDALQKRSGDFADWFKKTVDRAPVVAALVMNCGIAGDAMRFLEVATSEGVVLHQGQFDKGVTYLNALKSAAGDLILKVQEDMRISSKDAMTSSLLKHAAEIGLVHKEAGSSWRARLFGLTQQDGKMSRAVNWALDKVGYKQSTPFGRA